MRLLNLLLLISLVSLVGCATAADIVAGIANSGILESLARGTAESMLAANTDLSGTEIAALAGVIGTGTRALIAKPLEAYVTKTWGSNATPA
jgi:hypothetical protein